MTSRQITARSVVSGRLPSAWPRYIEAACFGAGFLLLAVYVVARADASFGSQQAVEAFRVAQLQAQAPVESTAPHSGETANVDTSLWAEARVATYNHSLAVEMRPPEALLRIPSIDLTVPVFEGTAELNLNRGVGRIEGTAALGETGNLGIAGHRDGFFRGLKDVVIGDTIEVQTLEASLAYRIADISIVEPTDVGVLDDTPESTLTLVTCYPFYFVGHAPQRYIVQAVRIDYEST